MGNFSEFSSTFDQATAYLKGCNFSVSQNIYQQV